MPNDPVHALHTAAQVRRIDEAAIAQGLAGSELMRRAAAAAFAVVQKRWPGARRLLLLAGGGNNGGDAFLLGALALREGLAVHALALTPESRGDAAAARAAFAAAGGTIGLATPDSLLPDCDACIDGLFGNGLARPLAGTAAALVERVNASGLPVLALDLPSGLDPDSGVAAGAVVRARATVCFVAWKRGLFTADGPDCSGSRTLATLDIPAALLGAGAADAELMGSALYRALPPRQGNSHKGDFGHVLAVGGDHGMGGAVRLAGEAALRAGAGLVSLATRPAHAATASLTRPELMPHAVDDASDLAPLLERGCVVAIGPGLGRGDWGRALLDAVLAQPRALVLDADALNLLAAAPRAIPPGTILTPHPGEAARLLGSDTAAIQGDRFGAVRALARRYQAVVVLKGAGSLVAEPSGRLAVCPAGNPGMATGGMGDLLTGVIAALRAQHLGPWEAACLGVLMHAQAGDRAAGSAPRGLLASDLLPALRTLANTAPA